MPPVFAAAISAVVPAAATTLIGGVTIASIAGNLLASVAISALMSSMIKDEDGTGGSRVETTLTGGTNPQFFPMGLVGTKGLLAYPALTHGGDDGTLYLTKVIVLSHIRGAQLLRVALDNKWQTINWSAGAAHPDYGAPFQGTHADHAWIKYYDGTQTAADPMLLNRFGSHPFYPYNANMIGRDICYAICTFKASNDNWESTPDPVFELAGIPLYDIRKDTSAGGSGTHRWNDRSTWEVSYNPIVMAYNIARGVRMGVGDIYGAEWTPQRIPFDPLVAAMNWCDLEISPGDAQSPEARYRAGILVDVHREPAEIIEELMKACAGRVADSFGELIFKVGGLNSPSKYINADLSLITEETRFTPFPEFESIYNGLEAKYPEPKSLYEDREAPPRFVAEYEAEDWDQRKAASVRLGAVPYRNQVQRLMKIWVNDVRRFRSHVLYFNPDMMEVEATDTIALTWSKYQYVDKLFEVISVNQDLMTLNRQIVIREIDPTDWPWSTTDNLTDDVVDSDWSNRPGRPVAGFSVAPAKVRDRDGDRIPAIRINWNVANMLPSVQAILWQIRTKDTEVKVGQGQIHDLDEGHVIVTEGVSRRATAYEVRVRYVWKRATVWSAWTPVTSQKQGHGRRDLEDGAVGGRKLKAKTWANDWPLWDLEDDIEDSTSDDATFEVSGGTSSYTWLAGGNAQGAGHLRITRDGGTNAVVGMFAEDAVPVRDTTHFYYIEFEGRTETGTSTGAVHPQVRWLNAQRQVIGTTNLSPNGDGDLMFNTLYRIYSDRIKAPAGTRYALGRVVIDDGGPSVFRIDRFLFRKANSEDTIADGKLSKRHNKKGDGTRQGKIQKGNTSSAGLGGTRGVVAKAIIADPETIPELIFSCKGDSLGMKVNGVMNFSAMQKMQLWVRVGATETKIAEREVNWSDDDNAPKEINWEVDDPKMRSGQVTYTIKMFRPNNNAGCPVNFNNPRLRVSYKIR